MFVGIAAIVATTACLICISGSCVGLRPHAGKMTRASTTITKKQICFDFMVRIILTFLEEMITTPYAILERHNFLTKPIWFDILSLPPWGGGESEKTMENSNTLRRLKTIEGHMRGIIRMVEEDAYCIDVIRQIQAVESALNKVSTQILEGHLNSCVITAIEGQDQSERERVLKEITEVFEMSTKV